MRGRAGGRYGLRVPGACVSQPPPADFTPWTPLQPIPDPAAMAQPQIRALVAFWRRVREDVVDVSPASADRLEKQSRAAAALSEEITEVLGRPLSIPMLQELHILATRDQTAARVMVTDGSYRYVPFPYGKLKDRPNHLTTSGRITSEFCPPERVVPELEAMLRIHDSIPESMPDVRAAWLVHAFLRVHPFVDGNGRVSRLLANWNFMRAGLPPVWGESSERGSGWADALDTAMTDFDLTPISALLVRHQERLVSRLLLAAEATPTDSSLDEVLAHRDSLAALRARWEPHAAAARDTLPALAEQARAALDHVASRLGGDLEVTSQVGSSSKAWALARENGVVADRHAPGAVIKLHCKASRTSIRVGLTALGTAGSGAWCAVVRVRPRSALPGAGPALVLLPEEGAQQRALRFSTWLDRVLPEAVGIWIRIV